MTAIINTQTIDGQVWASIQTPYNYDFVQDLKSTIHYTDRKWDGRNKLWMVTDAETNNALIVAAKHFEVRDQRGMSNDDADDDTLQAEIDKIKADQEYLVEQDSYIREAIAALNSAISRYSYTSKSHVKGRMCKDAALLSHSLGNAKKPIEQLVEMEIRGMAAAVRLIDKNSIARLTSR